MDNYQKFNQHIDPEKVNQTARELMSTISEVQEIFLYLQTHTSLSLIRCLAIIEQHIKAKEGKNLPDLLKPVSEEYPEIKLLPVYHSAVSHFSRNFPAAALRDYIKAKATVLEQQDFSQPENRIFLKVKAIDWEKIFAFLEDHYFLLCLWDKVKTHHPNIEESIKGLKDEFLKTLHNFLEVKKDLSAFNSLVGKSKSNTDIKMQMTSQMREAIHEASQRPVSEAFAMMKNLALQESCSIADLEFLLPVMKDTLENINLKKVSFKKVMLQKLLEYIKVDKGNESTQFLVLHDLLQLLYPYKFTPDATFLEEGPIFNKNGNMDGEVRRKKIREVKMIMDIPINR